MLGKARHSSRAAGLHHSLMNGATDGAGMVSEEVLIRLLSSAIRADDPRIRAELFVDLANKALAMADKTLGCQDLVTTTFTLRH